MKRNKILSVIFLVLSLCAMLFSCDAGGTADQGTATVIIENRDESHTVYTVDLSRVENRDQGAIGVLEELARSEGIAFTMGIDGMITELGPYKSDPYTGEWIMIYTSCQTDFDVSKYATTVSYTDKTLTSSGVGLGDMTVEDGTILLFKLGAY